MIQDLGVPLSRNKNSLKLKHPSIPRCSLLAFGRTIQQSWGNRSEEHVLTSPGPEAQSLDHDSPSHSWSVWLKDRNLWQYPFLLSSCSRHMSPAVLLLMVDISFLSSIFSIRCTSKLNLVAQSINDYQSVSTGHILDTAIWMWTSCHLSVKDHLATEKVKSVSNSQQNIIISDSYWLLILLCVF